MKIAILGWGSLLWQPKELAFIKQKNWNNDGPHLPVEFARISKDGRLTLVITPNVKEIQTYYAISSYQTVEEAILNLAIREGSGIKNIGSYDKFKDEFSNNFLFKSNIINWINKTDFDAVIWTNLSGNWDEKTNSRVKYLKELKGQSRALAEEYIRKTPLQIQTDFRKQVEVELNWTPITNE